MSDCTCGNGEAEEDRGAVLRCPVHGHTYPLEGGRVWVGIDPAKPVRVLDLTDVPESRCNPGYIGNLISAYRRDHDCEPDRLKLSDVQVTKLAGPSIFAERPDERLFDQLFGIPIERVVDRRSPREKQLAWELGRRRRQIERLLPLEALRSRAV